MSAQTRVIFIGQSLGIFDWLLSQPAVEVCAAFVPQCDRARHAEWFTRCALREVRLISSATPQDVVTEMPPGVDLGVCAHFEPLSARALTLTRLGMINIHPAPLPEYPGRYPLIDLMLSGAKEGGVTLHWMSPRVDQGDVIAVERFAVSPLDGPIELEVKAEHLARRALGEYWSAIIDGYAPRIPQAPRVSTRSDRRILCPLSAPSGVAMWRMLHAYAPYGGAGLRHTRSDQTVRIKRARLCILASTAQVPERVAHHEMRALHETIVEETLLSDNTPLGLYVVEVTQDALILERRPALPLLSAQRERLGGDDQQTGANDGARWGLLISRDAVACRKALDLSVGDHLEALSSENQLYLP